MSPQSHRTLHHQVSSSGPSSTASRYHILQGHRTSSISSSSHHHQHQSSQYHPHQQPHLRSPSPEIRDSSHSHQYTQIRREAIGSSSSSRGVRGDSPTNSTPSASSVHHHQRQNSSSLIESPADSQRVRYPSSSSAETASAISALPPHAPPLPLRSSAGTTPTPSTVASTPMSTAGKTTVQFSDVVECAQLLQAKYGNRCKEHPWGCVEITQDRHLELTIKMYLDWAGLVVRELQIICLLSSYIISRYLLCSNLGCFLCFATLIGE